MAEMPAPRTQHPEACAIALPISPDPAAPWGWARAVSAAPFLAIAMWHVEDADLVVCAARALASIDEASVWSAGSF